MTAPIATTDRSKNQSSIDDYPNQSYAPCPPRTVAPAGDSGRFEGGYTGADGSTGVSRDAVNQLVAGAPKKPAPQALATESRAAGSRGRSASECGYPAFKTAIVCAGGAATAVATTATVVGAFVAGAAAGIACGEAYASYSDCLEGKPQR
ncbi:MAG: hypothetical protein HYZ29_04435 [Myxococcales bacterium]|nr:hypothetical protein [Myxococcales bacterium]